MWNSLEVVSVIRSIRHCLCHQFTMFDIHIKEPVCIMLTVNLFIMNVGCDASTVELVF